MKRKKTYIFKCGHRSPKFGLNSSKNYICLKCKAKLAKIEMYCIDCGKLMTVKPQGGRKLRCDDHTRKHDLAKMRKYNKTRGKVTYEDMDLEPVLTPHEIITNVIDETADLLGWKRLEVA